MIVDKLHFMLMHLFATPIDWLTKWLLQLRNRHFFVFDVFALLLTPALALVARTENVASLREHSTSLIEVAFAFLIIKLLIFLAFGLYNRFWQYASIDELAKITLAVLIATTLQALVFFLVLRPIEWVSMDLPRSLPFLDGLFALLVVGGSRYSVRLAQRLQQHVRRDGKAKRVLVVGAGEAGVMIVEEMRSNPQLKLFPVAFVDDDADKQRLRIRGLNVLGGRQDIPRLVHDTGANLIVIAVPTASGQAVREIAEICKKTGVKTKTIPGVYELLDGKVSLGQLRDVQVEDLLRRPPVETDMEQVERLMQDSRVLVTGGGGSIGSELCRQILALQPAEVLLLGHGENSIFRIEGELRRRLQANPGSAGTVRVRSVIADIRDKHRLNHIFEAYQPHIVFHAAAHKHVPLMEANIEEAVTNNVLGTRNLLEVAEAFGTQRFILISTDKAVNPTSIMGATKRIAELLVRQAAYRTGRAFAAVRFGNVLGSRGSVLEVFREQIKRGGPITVTHPDVRRYFMTIPEAVHLVLQAASMGRGGEVFLLDMGEPTRIIDLARDLIRLSGMKEGEDIEISITGLRPGEKLFEELSGVGEDFGRTNHEKILVCKQNGIDKALANGWVPEEFGQINWQVDQLVETARQGDAPQLVHLIAQLVPDYEDGKRQALLERLELALTESGRRQRIAENQ